MSRENPQQCWQRDWWQGMVLTRHVGGDTNSVCTPPPPPPAPRRRLAQCVRGSVYGCRGERVCRDWAASCACTYVERHACTRVCDSFCPSGLLPHLYTKGGTLLLGRPFLLGPSQVLSLAPPPAPPHKQASVPGKREGDSWGLQRTNIAGAHAPPRR